MSFINKAILVGNLGRDPEIRDFPNGNQVCILSVATSNNWVDQYGDRIEKTEWHQVAIYKKSFINIARQQLARGSKVYVEGQLRTNKYRNRHGVIQNSTQVVVGYFNGVVIPLGNTNLVDQKKQKTMGEQESDYNEVNDSMSEKVGESEEEIEIEHYHASLYDTGTDVESSEDWYGYAESSHDSFDYRVFMGVEGYPDVEGTVNLDDTNSDWYLD